MPRAPESFTSRLLEANGPKRLERILTAIPKGSVRKSSKPIVRRLAYEGVVDALFIASTEQQCFVRESFVLGVAALSRRDWTAIGKRGALYATPRRPDSQVIEIVELSGPPGAGKSRILEALEAAYPPPKCLRHVPDEGLPTECAHIPALFVSLAGANGLKLLQDTYDAILAQLRQLKVPGPENRPKGSMEGFSAEIARLCTLHGIAVIALDMLEETNMNIRELRRFLSLLMSGPAQLILCGNYDDMKRLKAKGSEWERRIGVTGRFELRPLARDEPAFVELVSCLRKYCCNGFSVVSNKDKCYTDAQILEIAHALSGGLPNSLKHLFKIAHRIADDGARPVNVGDLYQAAQSKEYCDLHAHAKALTNKLPTSIKNLLSPYDKHRASDASMKLHESLAEAATPQPTNPEEDVTKKMRDQQRNSEREFDPTPHGMDVQELRRRGFI